MAKLVFVATTIDRGGAEILLLNSIATLKREHEVRIIYFKGKGTLLTQFRELGVEPLRFSLGTLLRTVREIRLDKGCIIQGWMYHGNLLASLLQLLSGNRSSLFWAVHHSARAYVSGSLQSALRLRFTALYSRFPAKVVYVSEPIRDEHLAFGYYTDNAAVIHNGIDPMLFSRNPAAGQKLRAELGIADSDLVLGAVGRNHPIKDYPTFFRAVALLLPKHPNLHIVIAGRDLELSSFATQLKELGAAERKRIHLLGERNDVPQILSALDIYALSSLSESFSLSLIEALATEHCCVSSDVIFFSGLFPSVLRSFKPQDAVAMAEQVESFLALSSSERERLGAEARQTVLKHFSIETMLRSYEALWKRRR